MHILHAGLWLRYLDGHRRLLRRHRVFSERRMPRAAKVLLQTLWSDAPSPGPNATSQARSSSISMTSCSIITSCECEKFPSLKLRFAPVKNPHFAASAPQRAGHVRQCQGICPQAVCIQTRSGPPQLCENRGAPARRWPSWACTVIVQHGAAGGQAERP